ncbi:hypothetical protein IP81_08885 [Novosphingobium sp. AAP83]|uniref:VOC family protein n=1 Tax=Novosphingobium sp. AAP83 TaxID=1523425 RepID=UPI0006B9542F|nr:VOC family protein [Novosphingobium sp. AAP83]KPF92127.1 hypothetical protein IP81_08885 [Novosphingobium sp. AAP83]
MDILSGIFHHGTIVDNLEDAMADITCATGVTWSPIRAFDPLRVWTPEGGRGEAWLRVAYSRPGPIRFELVETPKGTPYDVLRTGDNSHIGVWVDNVGDALDLLCAQGWQVLIAGASPRHRYGSMAYIRRENGPVIELVGKEIAPMLEEWWG